MTKKKNKKSRKKAQSGATEPQCQSQTSKEVYFAILPDKYEPLIEELDEEDRREEEEEETPEERRRRKEDKERRKKEKYKRYRKNVGKALRFSWRCLVAGLHSMAGAYAAPMSAATAVVIGVQSATASKA